MARKRRPVDPGVAERLFSDRLKRLRGDFMPVTNRALQALVGAEAPGATTGERTESADTGVAEELQPEQRTKRARRTGRRLSVFRGVTVSLSAQDLKDADFIASAWSGAGTRRISRSQVIRAAIRDLRESLEGDTNSG